MVRTSEAGMTGAGRLGKKLLLLLSRFRRVRLCATPQTAAHQAPPSLGFSRQEHWSGLPLPSPGRSCYRIPAKTWRETETTGVGLDQRECSTGALKEVGPTGLNDNRDEWKQRSNMTPKVSDSVIQKEVPATEIRDEEKSLLPLNWGKEVHRYANDSPWKLVFKTILSPLAFLFPNFLR